MTDVLTTAVGLNAFETWKPLMIRFGIGAMGVGLITVGLILLFANTSAGRKAGQVAKAGVTAAVTKNPAAVAATVATSGGE